MPDLHQIKYYLKHLIYSKKGGHGVHSPFVFDFVNNIIKSKIDKSGFIEIEKIRKSLLKNKNYISINDLGAGSKKLLNKRRISDIAKYSLKPQNQAILLYKIIKYYKPENIIELGTSLGITTLYLAKASKTGKIITIEGDKSIFEIAKNNFKKLNIQNISAINANFDDFLPDFIKNQEKIDFAFIDGNHTKSATIKYFNLIKQKIQNNSIIVFDDIYWNKEMTDAWQEIIKDNDITVSIDLFYLGIVFFRKENPKQNFKIFCKF